jgi:hypothetical protein
MSSGRERGRGREVWGGMRGWRETRDEPGKRAVRFVGKWRGGINGPGSKRVCRARACMFT